MRSPRQRVAAVFRVHTEPASYPVIRLVAISRVQRMTSKCRPSGCRKRQPPLGQGLDEDLPFVHQAVVQAAQSDEIRELGLPALGPVLDVVRIHIALMGAAGEAAAAIAGVERAANPRRGCCGSCARHRAARRAGSRGSQQTRIAGERRTVSTGIGGPVLDLAAPGAALLQGLGIHVYDDLIAIGGSLQELSCERESSPPRRPARRRAAADRS